MIGRTNAINKDTHSEQIEYNASNYLYAYDGNPTWNTIGGLSSTAGDLTELLLPSSAVEVTPTLREYTWSYNEAMGIVGSLEFKSAFPETPISVKKTTETEWHTFTNQQDLLAYASTLDPSAMYNVKIYARTYIDGDIDNINMIARECFASNTSITKVTIPSAYIRLFNAFKNCSNLRLLVMNPLTPPDLDIGGLDGTSDELKILVPPESASAYKTAQGWSDYADKIFGFSQEVIDEPLEITSNGTIDCPSGIRYNSITVNVAGGGGVNPAVIDRTLIEITENDLKGVTSIGDYVFSDYTSLINIAIPESATLIGSFTFKNCTSLTTVTIPESVTVIGEEAFSNCVSLTNIPIPEGVVNICSHAFSWCNSLTTVTIPESVNRIGFCAFSYCMGLTRANLYNTSSEEKINIPHNAWFYGCMSNLEIHIPTSVTDPSIAYGYTWNNFGYSDTLTYYADL